MGIAFAQLGWVIALFFVIIMCPINIYIGMLLAECRFLVSKLKKLFQTWSLIEFNDADSSRLYISRYGKVRNWKKGIHCSGSIHLLLVRISCIGWVHASDF